jgi:hypothetical protein
MIPFIRDIMSGFVMTGGKAHRNRNLMEDYRCNNSPNQETLDMSASPLGICQLG